jgi:glycosyltransferase involved in cell wall biosynthesis
MKVVHVFKDCFPPTTGGIEQHMNLLCRLLAQTVDVTILVPSRSRHRVEELLQGVRIIRVPEFGRYASVPFCPTAPLELHRLRPDIVHIHFPNPMGDLTLLLGAPSVPFVVTYHADIIRQKAFLPLYRPVMNHLFKKARKVILSAHENIQSPFLSTCRHKCVVIPFGVEIDAFSLLSHEEAEVRDLRSKLGAPVVLFAGVARHYKGLDVLLRAMAGVNGHLIIAGRGTGDGALKRLAADLGIMNKVSFCGEVSQSRLRILLNTTDIYVLPSINRCETFGVGQLEAMACYKPIVSTNLPTGVQSVNLHGITGLVVPPGEPDALADALNLLLSNPCLCAEFGDAARRHVEQKFRADPMVSKTLEVYRALV